MTIRNVPDGHRDSDIPGNRPCDVEAERVEAYISDEMDHIYAEFGRYMLAINEMTEVEFREFQHRIWRLLRTDNGRSPVNRMLAPMLADVCERWAKEEMKEEMNNE